MRAGVHIELLGELLARAEARIEVEQLQQVDDRLALVSASALLMGELCQNRIDINVLERLRTALLG